MMTDWRHQMFENSLDACIAIDMQGIVIDWNNQAESIFGWTKHEAVGNPIAKLIIPEEQRESHWVGLHNYRSSGDGPVINSRTRLEAIRRDGEQFPIELSVVPIGEEPDIVLIGTVRELADSAETKTDSIADRIKKEHLKIASSSEALNTLEDVIERVLVAICSALEMDHGHALMVDETERNLNHCGRYDHKKNILSVKLSEPVSEFKAHRGELLSGRVWKSETPEWLSTKKQKNTTSKTIQQDLAVSQPDQKTAFAIPIMLEGRVALVLEFSSSKAQSRNEEVLENAQSIANPLVNAIERHRWRHERLFMAAIVESSHDAVIGKNRAGTIISWNAGAERLYGFSEEEAIGKSIKIILPTDSQQEEQQIRDVFASGTRLSSFETRRQRKDGTLLDVSLTISSVRDSKGELIGSATIERDITPIKKTMKELHEREEQLRLLMESSGEAIYGIDLHGDCTFANRACAKTLGFKDGEDLLGRNMHCLMHHTREDGSTYSIDDCPINQALSNGKSVHVTDEIFVKQNGEIFPVEYWSSPIRRGNEIVGAVVVFEDSTEKIAAERTKAELASIVESCGDAIIGKSKKKRITSWNRGAELLYGYTANEVIGKPYELLQVDPEEENQKLREIYESDLPVVFLESKRRRKNGTVIEVGITESAIRDSRNKLVGTSTIERDISHRKKREEELEVAKTMAIAANQAKSEFLANISHELRTPMNAVLGMLGLALEEPLPDAMKDYLSTARNSAEILLLLLNDLLDFSRMEAGHFELDPEPFSLQATVDSVMKALSFRAHEKGLEIAAKISPDIPDRLFGDGFRLRQVITNLSENAMKFTDDGEVVLTVDHEMVDSNHVQLNFSVRDTGIGIAKDQQQEVFKPFTQADASSTRLRSGTGLGLAICQELVSKLNGKMWLESELGEGSTFHFTCQFKVLPETNIPSSVTELAGLPVLVVDDNRTNREILSSLLKSWSMEPQTAASAKEALQLVEESSENDNNFSLVIVDALMPDTDGFALIESLERRELNSSMILMVSAADRLTFEKLCEGLQIDAFLEKPVSRSDVMDAIMTSLHGPQMYQEALKDVRPESKRKLKILVAEDTPANQKVVKAILEKRGHSITITNNGREAFRAVQERHFDVVLMDVQMPKMDGYQATKAIRNLPRGGDIPIVAMTAHARRSDRNKCLAAGMNGYISKPFDSKKMINLVEKISAEPNQNVVIEKEQMQSHSTKVNQSSINLDIAEKRMGDIEIVRIVAETFKEDAPTLLTEIKEAIEQKDNPVARRAAHSLKGLLANFEAVDAVKAALRVENAAKEEAIQDSPHLVNELEQEVQQVSDELEHWLSMG